MPADADQVLRKSPFFKGLDDQVRQLLVPEAVIRHFRRGDRIFSLGDPPPGLYVVAEGLVRIFQIAPNGKTHVLHLAEPGWTFAEVAVLGGFPCPAYAEAAEDSTCVLIPTERFTDLLKSHHALCFQLLRGMSLWVRQLVHLLEDLSLRDAAGRVARYLLQADPSSGREGFSLTVMKKDLASHLNLTSETLSRTLRRLMEAELIEASPTQQIRIRDAAALRDVAEGLLPTEFE